MDYQQILTIILATFLALAIALWIALTVLLIKLVQSARRVTEKVEIVTDKAEAVADFLKHTTGPVAIGRALVTVTDMFVKKWSHNANTQEKE